jgi:hypothetical protein
MAVRTAETGIALAAVQLVIAMGCSSPEEPRPEAITPEHEDPAEEKPWQGTVNALVDRMGCILAGTVQGECKSPAVLASADLVKYEDVGKIEDPDRIELRVVCLEGLQVLLGSPSLEHVDVGIRADMLPTTSRMLVFTFGADQPAPDEHAGDCGSEAWGTQKRAMILATDALPIVGSNCTFSEPAMMVPLDEVVDAIESRIELSMPEMIAEEFVPLGDPSNNLWRIRIAPDGSYTGTTTGRFERQGLDNLWSLADAAVQAAGPYALVSSVGWEREQHGMMYRLLFRRQTGVQLLLIGADPPPSTASQAEVDAATAALSLWCALPGLDRSTAGCDWILGPR